MEKGVKVFVFLFLLMFSMSFSLVVAQEEVDQIIDQQGELEDQPEEPIDPSADQPIEDEQEIIDEFDEEYGDAEFDHNPGLTPDSAFYFIDRFFDRFGDELDVKEERIAEIKAMIEAGNIEAARVALENYRDRADELEREIDPGRIEEARRSAAAIRNALEGIEIPDEEREDFYDDIINREGKIVTAAKIGEKIKELCQALSKVDPVEYSKICRTGDDAPRWQKALDGDLTTSQREEARKFGEIMSQCFRTSGQECRCQEIPFPSFAAACSKAAPLATACEIERDEEACEALEDLEMPELPEHLQDIFDELENKIGDAQFELHAPRECRDAGITTPRECRRIMIESNAPEECKEALLSSNCEGERECKGVCEKIMFELHAPEECAGLDNPRDCAERFKGDFERKGIRSGGPDCRSMSDSKERLACYDGAIQNYGGHFEGEFEDDGRSFEDRFRETKQRERQCAESCSREGGAWDFSGGRCSCRIDDSRDEYGSYYRDSGQSTKEPDRFKEEFGREPTQEDFDNFEQYKEGDYKEGGDFDRESTAGGTTGGSSSGSTGGDSSGSTGSDGGTTTGGSSSGSTGGDSGSSSSDGGSSGGGSGGSTGSDGGAGITGSVIGGNRFLDYFFK